MISRGNDSSWYKPSLLEQVNSPEHDAHEEEGRKASTHDGSMTEESKGKNRPFTHLPFPADEDEQKGAKDNQLGNDGSIAPRLGHTAVLESKDEASSDAEHENGSDPVELEQVEPRPARRRCLEVSFGRSGLDEEDDSDDGDAAQWQVDVETETPSGMVRKYSAL